MAKESVYPDFTKVMGQFKMPSMDVNEVFAISRRNMEALSAANQMAAEHAREIAKRQVEVAQTHMEELMKNTKDMWTSGTPGSNASKQADLAKYFLESTLSNVREMAEYASKSNSEVLDVLHKRFVESVEEMNTLSGTKKAA